MQGLWIQIQIQIRMDPHSFSLLNLDPDPGGKMFQIKTAKKARKLLIKEILFNL